jgi:hypothetical protein
MKSHRDRLAFKTFDILAIEAEGDLLTVRKIQHRMRFDQIQNQSPRLRNFFPIPQIPKTLYKKILCSSGTFIISKFYEKTNTYYKIERAASAVCRARIGAKGTK